MNDNSLNINRRTIFDRLSIQGLSFALQGAIQFGALVLYSQLLTKEECGLFAIALMIAAFGTALSESGVGSCVVQSRRSDRCFLNAAFWTATSLAVVFYIVLFIASSWVDQAFKCIGFANVLRVVGVTIIMNGMASVPQGILLRKFAYIQLMAANVLPGLTGQLVVGGWLAYHGFGVWAPISGMIVYFGLRCVMLSAFSHFYADKIVWEKEAYADLFKFGIPLVIARLFNLLYEQGDKLVLGILMPLAFVASFDRAIQMVALPALFFTSILDSVLFPILSRIQHRDASAAREYLYRSQEMLLAVTVLVGVFFFFAAPDAVMTLLGQKWELAGEVASILFLAFPLLCFSRLSDCVLRAFGDVQVILWNKMFGACFALGGLSVGVFWGWRGVAVGYVMSRLAASAFALITMCRRLNLDLRRLLQTGLVAVRVFILLSALMVCVVVVLDVFITRMPLFRLVVMTIVCVISCAGCLWLKPDIAGREIESLLQKAKFKLVVATHRFVSRR